MKTEEFDLSKKRHRDLFKEMNVMKDINDSLENMPLEKLESYDKNNITPKDFCYPEKDVKEFIKLDYDLINLLVTGTIDFREFMIRRNKLAGKELVEWKLNLI